MQKKTVRNLSTRKNNEKLKTITNHDIMKTIDNNDDIWMNKWRIYAYMQKYAWIFYTYVNCLRALYTLYDV